MALEVEYKRTTVLASQILQSQAGVDRIHQQYTATKQELAKTATQRDSFETSLADATVELQSTQRELDEERIKHQSTLSALAAAKQEVEQLKSLTNVSRVSFLSSLSS
jgi:septal ring factor EnvC (AmiA/AmiB activator)